MERAIIALKIKQAVWRMIMDLEAKFYTVGRIDGDYAFLLLEEDSSGEEKCVARALLPAEISEGSRLKYEMMQYEMA